MVQVIPQPFLPVILGLIKFKSVVQKDFLCCVEAPQLGHPSTTLPTFSPSYGPADHFILLGYVWMGLWVWLYDKPSKSKHVNKAEARRRRR